MQRIMIIGGPGSGKSTLARNLGDRLSLPVYHMDREVHWLPGWVERAPEDKMPLVEAIIAKPDWVFEGGHSSSYAARLARADLLIWLDMPLALRMWRVIRRSFQQRGQVRPDLQDGCHEQARMLPGFLWFIIRVHRPARKRSTRFYQQASLPKHRFRSLAQVQRFLETIPPQN